MFSSKASRRQKLLDGEVGKLYDWGIADVDKGKQCGARGQNSLYWIFDPPIFTICWNRPGLEIKCKKFRQFLDSERARNCGDA
jgi:hypothetical protein